MKARPTSGVSRILMVDDHAVVRRGLRELLSHVPGLEVCGEAATPHDAMQLIEKHMPDLVIVDITLKDSNGIDFIKSVHARFPDMRMLVSSMHDESLYASRSVRAGALGYVCKQEPVEKLLEAIQVVLRGDLYLSPAAAGRLFRLTRSGKKEWVDSPVAELSDRELQVFESIGRGLSTRAIADRMNLSVKTIETHREHIKRKLSIATNTELIQCSFRWILEQQ